MVSGSKFRISKYNGLPNNHWKSRLAAIQNGMIGITVTASNIVFLYYGSGVITSCESDQLPDHAVVMVGVDYENQTFKIRNSWGIKWGNMGEALLSMKDNIPCKAAYYGVTLN